MTSAAMAIVRVSMGSSEPWGLLTPTRSPPVSAVLPAQACRGRVRAFTKSSSWGVVQHSCSSQNGA